MLNIFEVSNISLINMYNKQDKLLKYCHSNLCVHNFIFAALPAGAMMFNPETSQPQQIQSIGQFIFSLTFVLKFILFQKSHKCYVWNLSFKHFNYYFQFV